MQSQNSKSQKQIGQTDYYRADKTKSRLNHLQKTPSAIIHNPYIQQIGDRSTSKKRRDPPQTSAPPILIQQNTQLLTQNRQMAVIIHEKNATIESLQQKIDQKIENEISIFKEIQIEKKRFIQEILQHKQATDHQISDLGKEITKLQDEKQNLERQFHIELKKKELSFEQERQKENDQLKIQYQQAINLVKSQNGKLKQQLEKKTNELQIRQLDAKQKLAQATSKCQSLSEQLKHLQQVKKIEYAQLKMHYQSKIQKLHLENRREKELFFMEHESQVKQLENEIKRLKRMLEEHEDNVILLKETVDRQKSSKDDYQQKLQYEAQTNINHIKQMSIKQREKFESLLKAEMNMIQKFSSEEVEQINAENRRLSEMLGIKQKEIETLLKEIDELRENRLNQIEENENLIRELQSKYFTTLLEGEAQSEALKVKLAHLREADITGLRQYHEHQIEMLSRTLHEKQSALANSREKYHEELRKKIEMRKYFDLQSIKYKTRIIELQNDIDVLKAKLSQEMKSKQKEIENTNTEVGKEEISKAKIDQLKNDEYKQLQAIINSKDNEIEQLTKRLELLKENQNLERSGWQSQLKAQREHHELAKHQRIKNTESFQLEISKLKQLLKNDKEDFDRDFNLLKEQHRADFDAIMIQLSHQKEKNEHQKHNISVELKKRQLEIEKLNLLLAQKDEQILILKNVTHEQKANEFNKEREALEEFYKDQLKLNENQIIDLKERVEELASDLRDARQNYSDLEHKMQQLIESQSNLREIQRKVIQMGKENNLAKNMKEVVK